MSEQDRRWLRSGAAGRAVDAARRGGRRRPCPGRCARRSACGNGRSVIRLDAIAAEIDRVVSGQAALGLDTAMGAREFQKFLIAKQREISAVVSHAHELDRAKSAVLQSLRAQYTPPRGELSPAPCLTSVSRHGAVLDQCRPIGMCSPRSNRIRDRTGDPNAWQTGLTPSEVVAVVTPTARPDQLDAILSRIRQQHPDVFGHRRPTNRSRAKPPTPSPTPKPLWRTRIQPAHNSICR